MIDYLSTLSSLIYIPLSLYILNPECLMLTRYLMPDFFVSFLFSIKTFREGRMV